MIPSSYLLYIIFILKDERHTKSLFSKTSCINQSKFHMDLLGNVPMNSKIDISFQWRQLL